MRLANIRVDYKLDPAKLPQRILDLIQPPVFKEDIEKLLEIELLFSKARAEFLLIKPANWTVREWSKGIRRCKSDGHFIALGMDFEAPAKVGTGSSPIKVSFYFSIANEKYSHGMNENFISISQRSMYSKYFHNNFIENSRQHAAMLLLAANFAEQAEPIAKELVSKCKSMGADKYFEPKRHPKSEILDTDWAHISYYREYDDWFFRAKLKNEYLDAMVCAEEAQEFIKAALLERSISLDIGWESSPFDRACLLENKHNDQAWWKKMKQKGFKTELEYVQSRSKEFKFNGWNASPCKFCKSAARLTKVKTRLLVGVN